MKDSIDFARMDIPQLFRRLLIPTVLGMVFSAAFVITDGIFVGHGIGSGVWLGHYLHEGNDISLWFAGEGEAIFSTRSYVDDRPSSITIEAMCDAELYALPRRELELFFGESVEAANFGRRLFEVQFLDLENWLLAGGAPRAEERYRTLMEENPELLRVVPLKHIASYLWITPQSLSRIRARLYRKKP